MQTCAAPRFRFWTRVSGLFCVDSCLRKMKNGSVANLTRAVASCSTFQGRFGRLSASFFEIRAARRSLVVARFCLRLVFLLDAIDGSPRRLLQR